ncbi:uncharacterized protein LOC116168201 [Photinus pyralis]|uniref:THAP-type domain-containing protein n=1 Tax=Photinus pyralis TaxID=7054 RepID=A0A1Y1NG44_PHOPY|nr:uncharacterized protein LOC116168182 [Photinus pyralis]XP_031339754.1 uncharacterized protein LOC116168201 [Photinus pyralis]
MSTAGHTCVYFNCYKTDRAFKGISFFKFPVKDQERTETWRINCGNPVVAELPYDKLANKLICEDHFSPIHIYHNSKRKMLRGNAVPVHFEAFETEMTPVIPKEEPLSDREDSPPSPETMVMTTPLRTYVNKRFSQITSKEKCPNFSNEQEVAMNEIKQEPCDTSADPIKVLPPFDFNHASIHVGNGIRLFPTSNTSGEHTLSTAITSQPLVATANQNGAVMEEIKEEVEPGVINHISVPMKRPQLKFIFPHQYYKLKERYAKLKQTNSKLRTQIWRLRHRPDFNQTLYETLDSKPPAVKTFVLMQLIHRKSTAWTESEKQLALTIFKRSPSTYKLLSKTLGFVLPARKTIYTWKPNKPSEGVEKGQEEHDQAEKQNETSDGIGEGQEGQFKASEQNKPPETTEERQQDEAKEDQSAAMDVSA